MKSKRRRREGHEDERREIMSKGRRKGDKGKRKGGTEESWEQ